MASYHVYVANEDVYNQLLQSEQVRKLNGRDDFILYSAEENELYFIRIREGEVPFTIPPVHLIIGNEGDTVDKYFPYGGRRWREDSNAFTHLMVIKPGEELTSTDDLLEVSRQHVLKAEKEERHFAALKKNYISEGGSPDEAKRVFEDTAYKTAQLAIEAGTELLCDLKNAKRFEQRYLEAKGSDAQAKNIFKPKGHYQSFEKIRQALCGRADHLGASKTVFKQIMAEEASRRQTQAKENGAKQDAAMMEFKQDVSAKPTV